MARDNTQLLVSPLEEEVQPSLLFHTPLSQVPA